MSLLDLKNINGNNGFIIPGKTQNDRISTVVYSAGDINGDGIDDAIITATNAGVVSNDPYSYSDSDLRGKAYIVFGSLEDYDSTFDLDQLDGSNGFALEGIEENHFFGNSVSAGDINGDGIDDLVISASNAGRTITNYGFTYSDNKGEAYIIFGQQNFDADFNLRSLDGNNGFRLRGIDAEDMLGTAVTSAGDINGDGINDLAISASGAGRVTNDTGFTTSRGEVFVLFGKQNGLNSQINLAQLNGNNGFIIKGKDPNDSLGFTLSNGGDINGDGIDDLVIGSPNAGESLDSPFADGESDQRGEIEVIFGSKNGFNSRFNLANKPAGVEGFTISGIGIEDNLGSAISNAGDLNGDGIDDLILGAGNASVDGEYTQEGQVYVIFGGQNFDTQYDLNDLNGKNGFSIAGINSGDGLGNAVSAGDFNGDGIDDLLIGANTAGETISAYGYDYSDRRGSAYVIFGDRSGFDSQVDLANLSSSAGSKIIGINSDDLLGSAISSGGDINGDGVDDLIVSAPGVDLGNEYTKEGTTYVIFGSPQDIDNPQIIVATSEQRELFGGKGNDQLLGNRRNNTLTGNDGDDLLNGIGGNDSLNGNRGADTLLGGDNNDTLIGGEGNDLLDGSNNQDQLQGQSGNDTLIGGIRNDKLDGGSGNDTLNGSNPKNLEPQPGEQDTLIGGAGQDRFILGDEDQLYYQDGDRNTPGNRDFALIEDFDPQQDQIQLWGNSDLYQLSFFTDAQGGLRANLFYTAPGEALERVGIIEEVNPQLTLDDPAFIYVQMEDEQPESPSQIIVATSEQRELFGGKGNDQLLGNRRNNSLTGNDGDDLLNGIGGNDLLNGNRGADTLLGGDNNDTLIGGEGNDLLDGSNNQDQLQGQSGNDTLIGGISNDKLDGGEGNDTLNGSNPQNLEPQPGEQDTLIGGAGQDRFILGDEDQLYYQDGDRNTPGNRDFALIEDFDPQQDQIQLWGNSDLYQLSFFTDAQGGLRANLFYTAPGEALERVGIIEEVNPQLTLDDPAFIFI